MLILDILILSLLSVVTATTPSVTQKAPVRVAVAGGGPAGLLAAHALLSRGDHYHVDIFEAGPDPRVTPPGPRAYSLGLNVRGQSAIRYFEKAGRFPGLWSSIEARGVKSDSFFLHIGKNKFQIRKPVDPESADTDMVDKWDINKHRDDSPPPPTLLIQRNELCAAMLQELEQLYGTTAANTTTTSSIDCDVSSGTHNTSAEEETTSVSDSSGSSGTISSFNDSSGDESNNAINTGSEEDVQQSVDPRTSSSRLRVVFGDKLEHVDLSQRTGSLSSGRTFHYDLLIGCDGVQSAVRSAIMANEAAAAAAAAAAAGSDGESSRSHYNPFYAEEVLLPGVFKAMVLPCPEGIENDAVHAMEARKKTKTAATASGSNSEASPDTTTGAAGDDNVNFSLFLIPATNNRTCVLVSSRSKTPNSNSNTVLPLPLQSFSAGDATSTSTSTSNTSAALIGSSSNASSNGAVPVPAADQQLSLVSMAARVAAIQEEINASYPQFGAPSEEAVMQLLQQRPSEVRTVRCNRYHQVAASTAGVDGAVEEAAAAAAVPIGVGAGVLLMGDAAHSTGGALGQGANSALQDVVALDQCLDACEQLESIEAQTQKHALAQIDEQQMQRKQQQKEDASHIRSNEEGAVATEGGGGEAIASASPAAAAAAATVTSVDIPGALRLFSARQVPEGLALWQLLQLPPKGPWGILYQISQLFWGFVGKFKFLRRIFKHGRIPVPTQNALSQTLTPFSEIVKLVRLYAL